MSKIFKINKSVLFDVQKWSYGKTAELADEFGIHVNTLYAQIRGDRFNPEIWQKIMGKMREQHVSISFLADVLWYYCQSQGFDKAMYHIELNKQKDMIIQTRKTITKPVLTD